MSRKRKILIALGALVLVVAVVAIVWSRGTEETDLPQIAGEGLEDDDEELDDWLGPDDESERPRRRARPRRRLGEPLMSTPEESDRPGRREPRPDGGPEDEARARRAQIWLRGIEVVSLGPSTTELRGEDVLEGLRQARRAANECVRETGVGRGVWRSFRRVPRELVFDVAPDGNVVPGSFSATPPLPAGLDRCFAQAMETTPLVPTGSDGARVSVTMPTSRGARDGGVPESRPRMRPGP